MEWDSNTEFSTTGVVNSLWSSDDVSALSAQEQFRWVCDWLTEKKLFGTLDQLLAEYDVENPGVVEVIKPANPISTLVKVYDKSHTKSVLSLCCHPTRDRMITTDSEKRIVVTRLADGHVLASERGPFNGSIISLDYHPTKEYLLLGSMDDRHALAFLEDVDEDTVRIKTIQEWRSHSKYVVRVRWSHSGHMFATASHDRSVGIYSFDAEKDSPAEIVKTIPFSGAVEALRWLKDDTIVVATRDSCFLTYINTTNWEQTQINMNAIGDTHVSFTALELILSPNEEFLLVCTDNSRAILFKTGTNLQSRIYFGAKNDGMSQPRAAFDADGLFYLTSQDLHTYVYTTAHDSVVSTLSGHKKVIRDIKYEPRSDSLLTVSYDGTIMRWGRS